MSDYFGDIRLGDTIDVKFTTRQISGAPSTLSGVPVISAYPSNSVTELTAGITLTVDFDSRTGYNNVRVVATSGNGYLTATNYDLCITTGTVNSVSVVGESIGSFSIENRSALMPTTVARTLVVDASGLADANIVKVGPTGSGAAQTAGDIYSKVSGLTFTGANKVDASVRDWVGDTIPARNTTGVPIVDTKYFTGTLQTARDIGASVLVGDKTGFSLSAAGVSAIWQDTTASDFTTALSIGKSIMNGVSLGTGLTINGYTGNTPQTGDNYARTGAPAGASVSADIAAVKVDTAAVKVQTDKLAFTVANKVDANMLATNGDATAAANVAKTTRAIVRCTASGVPTTTSIPTSACTPSGAVADQFKGRIITFDADTTTTALRGQSTDITASSNSATPTFSVTALTTAPASGDTFSIT